MQSSTMEPENNSAAPWDKCRTPRKTFVFHELIGVVGPEGVPQICTVNALAWRTGKDQTVEGKRLSSGLANSHARPNHERTAAHVEARRGGFIGEFTARRFALRALRARVLGSVA